MAALTLGPGLKPLKYNVSYVRKYISKGAINDLPMMIYLSEVLY